MEALTDTEKRNIKWAGLPYQPSAHLCNDIFYLLEFVAHADEDDALLAEA